MTLVDTSIWVDYFRGAELTLSGLLKAGQVLCHPFVVGELALGNLQKRDAILSMLHDLPQAVVATDKEVLHLIVHQKLFGIGIGYVDAHLLAAARLTPDTLLWTRDKRLSAVAVREGLAAAIVH